MLIMNTTILITYLINFYVTNFNFNSNISSINIKYEPIFHQSTKSKTFQKNFLTIDSLINHAIKDSVFPGASILIAKDGKIIYKKGFGHFTYDINSVKVTPKTIYDLASVTKVIATTTATMICIDKGLFSLDDKVSKFIPQFSLYGKENITIKNLLLHNAGFVAYKKYHEKYDNADSVLNDIYTSPLEYETGTKTIYSDLGIITLGKIIEKVTGKTLDRFCSDEIFTLLGMKNTFYNPPSIYKKRIAPTELDNYWRNRLLIGEVHDETASLLNGISGNAGLFSTTEDLYKLLSMILNKGSFNGKRFINQKTVELFTKQYYDKSSRGLGWDTNAFENASCGKLFSKNSYGHTGYTGTSVWTDPDRKLIVILLTNRVYPTRKNTKIIQFRPIIHSEIINTIEN